MNQKQRRSNNAVVYLCTKDKNFAIYAHANGITHLKIEDLNKCYPQGLKSARSFDIHHLTNGSARQSG